MKKIFIFLFLLANFTEIFAQNAPTDFVNTYQGARRLDWSWTDNATDEDGYYVLRKLPADASFATIATLPANATTFMDCGVSPSTSYQYQVLAFKGASTAGSFTYNIATKSVANGEPISPSNLTLTMLGYTNLQLNWSDNSANETTFYIYAKAPSGTDFNFLTSIAANSTQIGLSISPANALFRYKIAAVNTSGESCFSNEVVVTPFIPATPNAPSGLIVTNISGNAISLAWQDNSNNETVFMLERSVDNFSYFQIGGNFPPNTTTYTSTELFSNVKYFYRVKACQDASCSAYSNIATATTGGNPPPPPPPAPCTAPNAPSNLVATTLSNKAINLTWNDNSNNETAFIVERSVDNFSFFGINGNLPPNTTSTTSNELFSGLKYYYRVKAVLGSCSSTYSNIANTTTNSTPIYIPPGGRIGANDDSESIVLPQNNTLESADLTVFPNPADDVFQVKLPEKLLNKTAILTITDAKGSIILQKNIENTSNENILIDAKKLAGGIYFLSVNSENEKFSKKIMVRN